MDNHRFLEALERHQDFLETKKGIGTLGEKSLHSILKYYYEPDESKHEIKIGRYVADIVNTEGIIEIQTRNFAAFRKKISFFLESQPVTIVYPLPHAKWICWIDETTGMVSSRRKSPKTGRVYAAFRELYRIKALLAHPNLSLCIILLDMEEYKILNGWSQDRKRGATRYERIPLCIKEEVWIASPKDYALLIPPNLPASYTSKDFMKASGLSLSDAQIALNILSHLGVVKKIGKKGASFLYES